MIDLEKTLCACNNVSAGELVKLIKEEGYTTLEEVLEQDICPVGDKCEACHEDGWDNDGFSIAMLLSLVKQNRL